MENRKAILFAIGLVIIIALSAYYLKNYPSGNLMVLVVAVLYCVVFFVVFRKRLTEKEKLIRAKIDTLKREGQPLFLEQEADFNALDREVLRKQKRTVVLNWIGGIFALCGISIFTVQTISAVEYKLFWQAVVLFVVIAGMSWVAIWDFRKLVRVIETGKKTIIRGIVTDKIIEGDETDIHYLHIDTFSLYVEKKVYNKYTVGDGIELHILKTKNNMVLYEAKITGVSVEG